MLNLERQYSTYSEYVCETRNKWKYVPPIWYIFKMELATQTKGNTIHWYKSPQKSITCSDFWQRGHKVSSAWTTAHTKLASRLSNPLGLKPLNNVV